MLMMSWDDLFLSSSTVDSLFAFLDSDDDEDVEVDCPSPVDCHNTLEDLENASGHSKMESTSSQVHHVLHDSERS